MKVEYINPFVSAAFMVMETCLGQAPAKGTLSMRPDAFASKECNLLTGVVGMVEGHVIYSMSVETADGIAARMIGSTNDTAGPDSFDQLAASAVAELANMITGNAMTLLSQAGFVCDITPPTLLRGTNIRLSTLAIPALVVPVVTQFGEVEITVSLRERK